MFLVLGLQRRESGSVERLHGTLRSLVSKMADSLTDEIPKLMERLGVTGQQLHNVKLGPGVVGRNSSIAWVAGVVMLAGVIGGVWLHSPLLVGGAILGGVLVGIGVPCLNVHFAKTNPAAAVLESAQFVQYHQLQLTASKGAAAFEGGAPVPAPAQLEGDAKSLPGEQERAE